MLTLQDVSEFVFSNLSDVTVSHNGQHFHCRCPLCGDSKKSKLKKRFHLNYKFDTDVGWKCFNCDESGHFFELVAILKGCSLQEANNLYKKFDKKRFKQRLTKTPSKIVETKNVDNLNWILKSSASVDQKTESIIVKKYQKILKEFINNRKITEKLFICYDGKYSNRIIIPIYDGGNIVYFQARSINENQDPKYLNPVVEKQKIILNKHNFDPEKAIAITEGIIDAWSIGNQATSILGKELNIKFLEKIRSYSNKKPIIVMDNDTDGINKLKEYLNKFNDSLLYFVMPKQYKKFKDINELLEKDIINKCNMYEFVVKNSNNFLSTKLLLKK